MLCKGDFMLVCDMQRHGTLFNLANDSSEIDDLQDNPIYADKKRSSTLLEKVQRSRI